MSELLTIAGYERAFGVTLPERFRRFLTHERAALTDRLAQLPYYQDPMPIVFSGDELESFVNEDWDEDGYGHPSAIEIDFDEDFAGYVPLATIGEEEAQVLLCDVRDPACPVVMWTQDSGEAEPVAASLDAFLAALTEEDE